MISKGGPWCSRSQGRRRCKSEATQASEPRFNFFSQRKFCQILRRETSPSVKVKLVNHIQLGVWRMKNDANIYWFYGFVGMCIFCHDVSFCDGILKKAKQMQITVVPPAAQHWPPGWRPIDPSESNHMGGHTFIDYICFQCIICLRLIPYGWPYYLSSGVFVFFNILIFINWAIWGATPKMLWMWFSLSLHMSKLLFSL